MKGLRLSWLAVQFSAFDHFHIHGLVTVGQWSAYCSFCFCAENQHGCRIYMALGQMINPASEYLETLRVQRWPCRIQQQQDEADNRNSQYQAEGIQKMPVFLQIVFHL